MRDSRKNDLDTIFKNQIAQIGDRQIKSSKERRAGVKEIERVWELWLHYCKPTIDEKEEFFEFANYYIGLL